MPELGSSGSVRGALRKERPYRDGGLISPGFRARFLGCVWLADVGQPHCDARA